jgi:membrane-associated phospholipid phosphatase
MHPWELDFAPDDAGNPPFPHEFIINPYRTETLLEWTTDDWDPGLRFWALPYDPQLGQWLSVVDRSRPSIMAAREFGSNYEVWKDAIAKGWLEADDYKWRPDPALRPTSSPPIEAETKAWEDERTRAWNTIKPEIEQLQQLMQDDRDRYLWETEAQADGIANYFISFIGASEARYPWTLELINCALSISNIAYMYYKGQFKRVRPSNLCPGLIPPFGPPSHPSFPSGHACAGHLIALFLLEIPALQQRYGIFEKDPSTGRYRTMGVAPKKNTLDGRRPVPSPLLWLAQRIAKGRERIGVHYISDSMASRHIAAGLWWALLGKRPEIDSPSLRSVLSHAKVEWATPW